MRQLADQFRLATVLLVVLGMVAAVFTLVASPASADTETAGDVTRVELDGPDVIHYGMGPYVFEDEGRLLVEGVADGAGGCVFEHEMTLAPGESLAGVEIAYDPSQCLALYATGELVAGGPDTWAAEERVSAEEELDATPGGASGDVTASAVQRHQAYTWTWVDEPARWAFDCDIEEGVADGCVLPPVNSVKNAVAWIPDGLCAITPGSIGQVLHDARLLDETGWRLDSLTWQRTPDASCRDTIWSRDYAHFSNELFCEYISDPIVNTVPIIGPAYDALVQYRTETHYNPSGVTGTKFGGASHAYSVSHNGDCGTLLRDGWKFSHTLW